MHKIANILKGFLGGGRKSSLVLPSPGHICVLGSGRGKAHASIGAGGKGTMDGTITKLYIYSEFPKLAASVAYRSSCVQQLFGQGNDMPPMAIYRAATRNSMSRRSASLAA